MLQKSRPYSAGILSLAFVFAGGCGAESEKAKAPDVPAPKAKTASALVISRPSLDQKYKEIPGNEISFIFQTNTSGRPAKYETVDIYPHHLVPVYDEKIGKVKLSARVIFFYAIDGQLQGPRLPTLSKGVDNTGWAGPDVNRLVPTLLQHFKVAHHIEPEELANAIFKCYPAYDLPEPPALPVPQQ